MCTHYNRVLLTCQAFIIWYIPYAAPHIPITISMGLFRITAINKIPIPHAVAPIPQFLTKISLFIISPYYNLVREEGVEPSIRFRRQGLNLLCIPFHHPRINVHDKPTRYKILLDFSILSFAHNGCRFV